MIKHRFWFVMMSSIDRHPPPRPGAAGGRAKQRRTTAGSRRGGGGAAAAAAAGRQDPSYYYLLPAPAAVVAAALRAPRRRAAAPHTTPPMMPLPLARRRAPLMCPGERASEKTTRNAAISPSAHPLTAAGGRCPAGGDGVPAPQQALRCAHPTRLQRQSKACEECVMHNRTAALLQTAA